MTSMNKSFEVIMRIDPYYMDNGKEQCFKGKGIQELIRCKDCIHYFEDGCGNTNYDSPAKRLLVVKPDWFCADGEKKEQNDE